ncbi:MAG: SPOR domain-containing protein, partial [Pseudomonadota bacterium]
GASATPPEASAAPSSAASSGPAAANGYVAVLASKGSRIQALEAFADLRQKYEGALQGRVPDIQAADLSSRGLGTMYRVVVGPPGSRESANSVCARLRTVGYTECWVKAY